MSYTIKFLDGRVEEFKSLVGANLERADLEGARLKGANLERANLVGANLKEANLRKANLYKADLYKANLKRVDLRKADLEHTCVISGTLGKHFYFYHEGYLKIGCEGESLEWWLENYKEVGIKEKYSKHNINMYGALIKFLNSVPKENKS